MLQSCNIMLGKVLFDLHGLMCGCFIVRKKPAVSYPFYQSFLLTASSPACGRLQRRLSLALILLHLCHLIACVFFIATVGWGIDVWYPLTLIILQVDLVHHFIYGTTITTDTDINDHCTELIVFSLELSLVQLSCVTAPLGRSRSHIMTDSQSASQSWCQAFIWDPWPILLSPWNFLQTITFL
jgi:hypothetical protein